MLGYAWAEDKEHCEENGRMLQANPSKVSQRAKKRGLPQVCVMKNVVSKLRGPADQVFSFIWHSCVTVVYIHQSNRVGCLSDVANVEFVQLGTLGAGNHYAEIQVVDEIFDKHAATKMGLDHKGQVRPQSTTG